MRADFDSHCAYCLLSEFLAGGEENFELDHFRPRLLFPELVNDYYNLYYSCHPCNQIKHAKWPSPQRTAQGITLVDLCECDFGDHFVEDRDGFWVGTTPSGHYTIDVLRLNRRHLVAIRGYLKSATIQQQP